MEEDMLFRLPQSILNVQSFRNGWQLSCVGVVNIAIAEIYSRRVLLENLFTSLEFEFENNNMANDLEANTRRDGHGFALWL